MVKGSGGSTPFLFCVTLMLRFFCSKINVSGTFLIKLFSK
ncbi:not available [Bacillus cereus]|nr:not available [Bacillus cereus]QBZ26158.1 not available [Bacillus cereus]